MLRSGDSWGTPTDRSADLVVRGSDAELAAVLVHQERPLVAWFPTPESDLARSIGLGGAGPSGTGFAGPMDLVRSSAGDAVNAIIWGTPPQRLWWGSPAELVHITVNNRLVWEAPATSVVIANGDFVHGQPIAPRAHPGDGVLDLIIVGVPRHQRRLFRTRLRMGEHLGHPGIRSARGHKVVLKSGRTAPVWLDGIRAESSADLEAHLESDRWAVLL